MIRAAINGFGRIGRTAFKIALDKYPDKIEVVAINDLTDPKTLAHLLKYDSNYGIWKHEITSDDKNIIVDGKSYPVYAEKEPEKLPWKKLDVDVVIESTGKFTDSEGAGKHIKAGARRIVISAPVHGDGTSGVKTFVLGVNGSKYSNEEIISNASCTTNCIAPVAAVMNLKFGILKAMMTTVHGYTADQNLQDGPHRDLRRARSAAENIVPTTTGAAIATTETIPELKGLFDGAAIRVPVSVGSISDFTFLLKKKVTVEEVNNAFKEVSKNPLFSSILAVTEDPIVSSDIVGRSESAIVDLSLTQVVDGDMVKVFAWYDNEFGYSNRLVEQVLNVGRSLNTS
ncbi:type I glyceraldehyde-3-phosphate dehydrogenase [Candidatus Daviesbacteria bacterium RIFCSPHIGHO2_01_FULL_37_27]|nr:MAG: type I glyceraldehyde-3-phosphate dehydrogenase [Candidatus Daviesbacteria bacterium RIFCSPHIGHO2_01_FULL_37_27]OGE45337.1 MAG: type I glyceraldehyde-3-phosphate dehydrogenase [Candidatus Daviesbacteria bacterium RIFCSPLOWO2_01_FULL_37_10]